MRRPVIADEPRPTKPMINAIIGYSPTIMLIIVHT